MMPDSTLAMGIWLAAAVVAVSGAAVHERRRMARRAKPWSAGDRQSASFVPGPDMVRDAREAAEMFRQVQRDLALTFGFMLPTPISARLSSTAEINRIMGGPPPDGVWYGVCDHDADPIAIHVDRTLPRPLFYAVLAHEYAHVWQRMHRFKRRDFEEFEGFAEWVALVLTEKAGYRALESFDRAPWDPYGTGMRKYAALEEFYSPARSPNWPGVATPAST